MRDKIVACLRKYVQTDGGPIGDLNRYDIDSINVVNIIMDLEDAFGIRIPNERMTLDDISSVERIEGLVASLLPVGDRG